MEGKTTIVFVVFPFEKIFTCVNFVFNNYLMTSLQIELFWKEIEQIQIRHALFFPISQIKYISLQEKDSIHNIIFLKGYNLPGTLTNEIQLAFKIINDLF